MKPRRSIELVAVAIAVGIAVISRWPRRRAAAARKARARSWVSRRVVDREAREARAREAAPEPIPGA